jgi:hypothetical protein
MEWIAATKTFVRGVPAIAGKTFEDFAQASVNCTPRQFVATAETQTMLRTSQIRSRRKFRATRISAQIFMFFAH